ncbi:hypothetical protein [Oceanobacillus rekensis]|uniref:hypothetical protein n=1 Tax=Oceanobacillus rekensis TaxID=937927 RepID=UPI000B447FD5|nr:hypothetical protein [Oceanobacillus rekensis]
MSNKLITIDKAKKEVERLKKYIELVENYETYTLEKWIIKRYAISNSIRKILEESADEGITNNGVPLDRGYISSVINGKATDELHRIVRLGYRHRIKPNKRNYKTFGR